MRAHRRRDTANLDARERISLTEIQGRPDGRAGDDEVKRDVGVDPREASAERLPNFGRQRARGVERGVDVEVPRGGQLGRRRAHADRERAADLRRGIDGRARSARRRRAGDRDTEVPPYRLDRRDAVVDLNERELCDAGHAASDDRDRPRDRLCRRVVAHRPADHRAHDERALVLTDADEAAEEAHRMARPEALPHEGHAREARGDVRLAGAAAERRVEPVAPARHRAVSLELRVLADAEVREQHVDPALHVRTAGAVDVLEQRLPEARVDATLGGRDELVEHRLERAGPEVELVLLERLRAPADRSPVVGGALERDLGDAAEGHHLVAEVALHRVHQDDLRRGALDGPGRREVAHDEVALPPDVLGDAVGERGEHRGPGVVGRAFDEVVSLDLEERLSVVSHELAAQALRVRVDVHREALRDGEPHVIGREGERAVLGVREGDRVQEPVSLGRQERPARAERLDPPPLKRVRLARRRNREGRGRELDRRDWKGDRHGTSLGARARGRRYHPPPVRPRPSPQAVAGRAKQRAR